MSRRSPADVAYERVRAICLQFPAAEEKLSHGAPSFHVRGKMFLTFVDDHHGDGRLAVWCKSTSDEQRRLVTGSTDRFFVPPYVGVKGWVGVNVDARSADFVELAMLVEEAWRSVAPARVVDGRGVVDVGRPATLPRSARVTTDAAIAREALQRMTAICEALPEAEYEREGRHATFRVRKKVFAYFLDNHHGDGVIAACVRGDKRENARLVAKESARFYSPAYLGPRGYLGIRLDGGKVDWKEVARRIKASYLAAAPGRRTSRQAQPG